MTNGSAVVMQAAPAVERLTYSAGKYWDDRYSNAKPTNFDWFFNYSALQPLFNKYLLIKDLPCLHVGCGNSTLQQGLIDDGLTHIINVDISPVVIDQMKVQHMDQQGLTYQVCDCRCMPEFATSSFGAAIDKGTLDAVLCGQQGQQASFSYLQEIERVLVPGGTFLLISLAPPSGRLELFSRAGLTWDVEVLMLPKPLMYLKSEASLTGRTISSVNQKDKSDPVEYLGPFPFSTYREHPAEANGTETGGKAAVAEAVAVADAIEAVAADEIDGVAVATLGLTERMDALGFDTDAVVGITDPLASSKANNHAAVHWAKPKSANGNMSADACHLAPTNGHAKLSDTGEPGRAIKAGTTTTQATATQVTEVVDSMSMGVELKDHFYFYVCRKRAVGVASDPAVASQPAPSCSTPELAPATPDATSPALAASPTMTAAPGPAATCSVPA